MQERKKLGGTALTLEAQQQYTGGTTAHAQGLQQFSSPSSLTSFINQRPLIGGVAARNPTRVPREFPDVGASAGSPFGAKGLHGFSGFASNLA